VTTTVRADVAIRPIRRYELAPLADALVEVSEAQLLNRWHEQEMGYRELLVAELEGALVGTVSIANSNGGGGPSVHLFALEVAPAVRSRGIGGAIVRYVLDEAARRGRSRVYLEVRVDNPARRLYHRLGFRRVGRAFLNAYYQFNADGTRERIEEPSYRMVRRVRAFG
jgi:ribosomal protein S18 acetylase RimI-like enzyme